MTTCCPYRHISYTSWRYQTFQWLFVASCNSSTAPLFFTQPPLAGDRRRRSNSCSLRTLARDNVSYKPRAAPRRALGGADEALRCLQDNVSQSDGIDIAASEEEHCLQLEPGQISRLEEEHASQLYLSVSLEHDGRKHNPPQDEGVTPGHEKKQLKRRQKRQQWSPYNKFGNDGLRNLGVFLQESLESLESPGHGASEVASRPTLSSGLPVSPLVQAFERKKATKTLARAREKEELADNPWATMLASPMRLCSATGVRLPKDLLVPWGLVRNPATKEVCLMPTELAELDALKDNRRSSKASSTSTIFKISTVAEKRPTDLKPEPSALQVTGDIVSDSKGLDLDLPRSNLLKNTTEPDARLYDSPIPLQASKSSSLRPTPSMIYMLPSLPLLHHLTLRFTSLQKNMVTPRSKPNAINSILPWRWKASVDRAKFYAQDRGKISPPSTLEEAANAPSLDSFQHVKWEIEINDVMLRILRERVLATLEMLGNRNQKLWRQESELVKAGCVTWTSDAENKEGFWGLLVGGDYDQPLAERGEGPDVERAKICLLFEPDGAIPPASQRASLVKRSQVDEEKATQSSDVGSSQFVGSFVAADGSWRNHSNLEPSTIKVEQSSRVPLFSLNDLLGADHIARFRQLSAAVGVLAPRGMAAGDVKGHAYVLIVPANAFGAKPVVEEVWRLWRFLGGRRA